MLRGVPWLDATDKLRAIFNGLTGIERRLDRQLQTFCQWKGSPVLR